MTTAIIQVHANQGVLGAYCNMLMLAKALYGRLPKSLPARLEDVIDGSVKSGRDLTSVIAWVNMAAYSIVDAGKPVPTQLHPRIMPSLIPQAQRKVKTDNNHWLTTLINATNHHLETYQANTEALLYDAEPPAELFNYTDWVDAGTPLRQLFATAVRRKQSPEAIEHNCISYLTAWKANKPLVLLGTAIGALRDSDRSDAVLWYSSMANQTIAALRHIGLIGEPLWTKRRRSSHLRRKQCGNGRSNPTQWRLV